MASHSGARHRARVVRSSDNRVCDGWVDLIHLEGFSRDCFAWRKRMSPLIVSPGVLVQRQVEGSALDVPCRRLAAG